ncbi:hypothetical protein, partial [Burkholderia pseudomallei]|uniref:hypothetical protein n=1 Tax=Burkholderia pseudomallei TaxID=28450 RepID=UPI001CA4A1B6
SWRPGCPARLADHVSADLAAAPRRSACTAPPPADAAACISSFAALGPVSFSAFSALSAFFAVFSFFTPCVHFDRPLSHT